MAHKEETDEPSNTHAIVEPENMTREAILKNWKTKEDILNQFLKHEEKTFNQIWKKLPNPVYICTEMEFWFS
jgi:hypothetical protein